MFTDGTAVRTLSRRIGDTKSMTCLDCLSSAMLRRWLLTDRTAVRTLSRQIGDTNSLATSHYVWLLPYCAFAWGCR